MRAAQFARALADVKKREATGCGVWLDEGFVVLKGEGRKERRKDEKQIFYITRKIKRNAFPDVGSPGKVEKNCCQFSSVSQSCLTLCGPMNCSTPGFSVHHELPKLAQTHVQFDDAIQSSHQLLSTSPPASSLSQHQGPYHESVLPIRWPKYWSFSFSTSPSNEYSGPISFSMDW